MTRGRGHKFHFGFSPRKDNDGKPTGCATLKYKPRNAYELLGLRRPPRPALGKS
jgi:hypothetical protein